MCWIITFLNNTIILFIVITIDSLCLDAYVQAVWSLEQHLQRDNITVATMDVVVH